MYLLTESEIRAINLGKFIVENKCTVRKAAKEFKISKSTVHKDVSKILKDIDYTLWCEVVEILSKNKAERHIKGGMATKKKYEKMKVNK